MPNENKSPRIGEPRETTPRYTNEPNFPRAVNQANPNNPWSLFDRFRLVEIGFVWVRFFGSKISSRRHWWIHPLPNKIAWKE
jgi:hypothetical protein